MKKILKNHPASNSLFIITIILISQFALLACKSSFASVSGQKNKILQFSSGSHVMGFLTDGVYVAGGDHMLKVEFVGTKGVLPIADDKYTDSGAVQTLSKISYPGVWPGVSLNYVATTAGIVESTWRVESGGDPGQIRMRYNAPIDVGDNGDLKIFYETGWMRESAPIAWQEIDGHRVSVQIAFSDVDAVGNGSEVGFTIGEYNPLHPLLIDPVLQWNTFLGSANTDYSRAIAMDPTGNIYIAGTSNTTWGVPVNAHAGGDFDAFAAKLNPDGVLQWHTFMGSSGTDYGNAIAFDPNGNVLVAGLSGASWGLPVTNPQSGINDAFVAKLDADTGVRVWHTYVGSSDYDSGNDIVVDGFGSAYLVGTSDATWGTGIDAPIVAYAGGSDAFVAKLTIVGNLEWHTFLGSASSEEGYGIAIDSSQNLYLTGNSYDTWGANPVHAHGGWNNQDIFAAKLDSFGVLQWNTFLGSVGDDDGRAIEVDVLGNIYIAGTSAASWGTPIEPWVALNDALVLKLGADGVKDWHSYLGSTNQDYGRGLAVDSTGNIFVVGQSIGSWGGGSTPGGQDAFIAKVSSTGVLQSTYLMGSSNSDDGTGIVVDGSGNLFVTGGSSLPSWGGSLTVNGHSGASDAFVAKLGPTYTVNTSAPASEGYFTPTVRNVIPGQTAVFYIYPEADYTIDTVSGCGGTWTGSSNRYETDVINADCTVTATFVSSATYTVSTSAPPEQGSVTPVSRTVNHNTTATFEVNTEAGYSINSVTGCGGTWTGSSPYITGPVTSDCTVVALYNLIGDVDVDNSIGIADAILALQISAGITPAISVDTSGDVDNDGKIGVTEAIFSLKKALE